MMLRHFINALLVAAASASLWSCAGEDLDSGKPGAGEGNVTLTFSSARSGSRAADDTNNEDAINSLHVFLYAADATDDAPARVSQAFTGLGAKQQTTVKMSVELDAMAALIGHDLTTAGTCRMVAVANLPAGVTLPENATVNQLRAQAVTADFGARKVQDGFVMIGDTSEADRTGNSAVTFTPDGKGSGTGRGNVMLVRAAARISLALSVPELIEVESGPNAGTWHPVTDGMQVLLTNGVSRAAIDPSRATVTLDDGDYFRIGTSADADRRYGFTNSEGMAGGSAYPWKMPVPFYTYPNRWEKIATEQHRTSMTLIVPFQKNEETEYQTCYYSVPVVKDPDGESNTYSLKRNTAYQVNLSINMLGSFSPQEPLDVEAASYQAVDWAEVPTDVNIKDYRYLVVNQNNYVVDNQPSISIPFYTSHPVKISNITMSYKRFNAVRGGNGEVVDIIVTKEQNHQSGLRNTANQNDSIFSYRLDKDATGKNVLVIDHKLVPWTPRQSNGNAISENQAYRTVDDAQSALNAAEYYTPTTGTAYSQYTFTVTIMHDDQEDAKTPWQETLTITQYPGMWILADRNNGDSGDGSDDGRTYLNYGPYMSWSYSRRDGWTSSQQSASNDWTGDLGGLHGLTATGNKNPNMYVITINTLSSDTKYIIDDPRTLFSDNNLDANGALPNPTSNGKPAPNSIDDYTETGSGNNRRRTAGWCAKAPALYPTGGPDRSLTYYYPTNESETNKMVVAPKIRVASSYGVCDIGRSRTEARRRCATYQEQDRPAGRWRVPTLGEMQFIVNLSQTNKIPILFSKSGNYFCAQGQVHIPDSDGEVTLTTNTGSYRMSVRCVYDEWYWEKQTNYTITPTTGYRLGDMPKNNPEEGIK